MKRTIETLAVGMMVAASSDGVSAAIVSDVFINVDARVGGASATNFGSIPATYTASAPEPPDSLFATSSLDWTVAPTTTSFGFTGSAAGAGPSQWASVEAAVVFSLATASTVWITWDFANIAATSTSTPLPAAWSVTSSDGESVLFGLRFEAGDPIPITEGGVPVTAAGTGPTGFVGLIPAGTWIFGAIVEVDATVNGGFNVQITLPAPGALPLVAVASLIARRGRRR